MGAASLLTWSLLLFLLYLCTCRGFSSEKLGCAICSNQRQREARSPILRYTSKGQSRRSWAWTMVRTASSASSSAAAAAEASTPPDGDRDERGTTRTTGPIEIFFKGGTTAPYLAVITVPDACDSDERLARTLDAIRDATKPSSSSSASLVDLVSIRLNPTDDINVRRRAFELARTLVLMSKSSSFDDDDDAPSRFYVVCSSDWVRLAIESGAHGIHVKQSHQDRLPTMVREWHAERRCRPLIGASVHSVASALESFYSEHHHHRPDYYFCGTCYATASHPEKTSDDHLEGPRLPGMVRRALENAVNGGGGGGRSPPVPVPPVLAIGGIDERNCAEPVRTYGADGVAVIRAVLQAERPSDVVQRMKQLMSSGNGAE